MRNPIGYRSYLYSFVLVILKTCQLLGLHSQHHHRHHHHPLNLNLFIYRYYIKCGNSHKVLYNASVQSQVSNDKVQLQYNDRTSRSEKKTKKKA